MRAVDTNVLVRLVTGDNPEQSQAAEDFIGPGAWASCLVLAETVWVLDTVYERKPPQIVESIEMLLDHEDLTLQEPEVVKSALEHYRKRPSLRFSDCLILEIARKAGHIPLGTFDRAFAKLPDIALIKAG
jgi:predicted nucleic-acid-binding protein